MITITQPPPLSDADRYVLANMREVRRGLRRSQTFQPYDVAYCDVVSAWRRLTDQLFGRDIAHAYRVGAEASDDVDAVLAAAFEATARLVADNLERWPDAVLRNARPTTDRFELLAARALEIRQKGTRTAVAPPT